MNKTFVHIPLKNYVSAPACVMGDGPVASDSRPLVGKGLVGVSPRPLLKSGTCGGYTSSCQRIVASTGMAHRAPEGWGGCDASL